MCRLLCLKIKHWIGNSLRILFKFVDRSWTYSVLIKRALGWVQHTKDYMRTLDWGELSIYCERPFAFISMLCLCTGCVSINWLDWGFSTTCLCTLSMLQTVPAYEWLTGHLAFQYSTGLREAAKLSWVQSVALRFVGNLASLPNMANVFIKVHPHSKRSACHHFAVLC